VEGKARGDLARGNQTIEALKRKPQILRRSGNRVIKLRMRRIVSNCYIEVGVGSVKHGTTDPLSLRKRILATAVKQQQGFERVLLNYVWVFKF
jgi:hypothetical protein